jgi:hypothetical protein
MSGQGDAILNISSDGNDPPALSGPVSAGAGLLNLLFNRLFAPHCFQSEVERNGTLYRLAEPRSTGIHTVCRHPDRAALSMAAYTVRNKSVAEPTRFADRSVAVRFRGRVGVVRLVLHLRRRTQGSMTMPGATGAESRDYIYAGSRMIAVVSNKP